MDVRTEATASAPVITPQSEYFPPPASARQQLRWLMTIRHDRDQLIQFWPVIHNMVAQELRVRYQRSMLGFFWTLLNPILMMTTLSVVFSKLLPNTENFPIYLFAGMVPWGFLVSTLNDCSICIIINEGLIRKIYLPKLVFPLSKALINLSTFLLSMSALFILLLPLKAPVTTSLLALPLIVGLFFLFALGLGLIVATANTFFRDFGHLVGVFLQAWYFVTPIMYEPKYMPEAWRWRFWLNPAYPFIKAFQEIIRDGHWPQLSTIMVAAGYAAMSLGIGYATFKSHEDKLVFRL